MVDLEAVLDTMKFKFCIVEFHGILPFAPVVWYTFIIPPTPRIPALSSLFVISRGVT
jgi:hypothetical protein